jgi:dTDP-4-dehydrorhamnose 3,5-epimerase
MRRQTIDGIIEFSPKRFGDDRGYFAEVYSKRGWEKRGLHAEFVQDNESLSVEAGTVRGLHFQIQPSAQGKLVRCQQGALLDVAVDIRHGSPTFGDHVSIRLDPDTGTQLWVPPGFAHGFCTLEPSTVIAYKVTRYYDPDADRGIRWDDPDLGIQWPVTPDEAVLSPKDGATPTLAQFGSTAGLF